MGLGFADGAQADVFAGAGGQHDVERTGFGHLFERLARGVAQCAALHPLLEGAPHHEREEADEDVRLGAFLFLVVDGPQVEVVFADAEGVLDLGQSDVGLAQCRGVLTLKVGAQEGTAVGEFGPFAVWVVLRDGDA